MFSKQLPSSGFSLLEVMVVVFLIATIAAVGLLKLGSGQNIAMEAEAKQFVDKLNLLMDESIITGYSHRIVFEQTNDEYSYFFQQLQSSQWQDLDVQPYLKRTIDPNLALLLTPLAQSENLTLNAIDQASDNVVISSDGSVNVFELRIGEKNNRNHRLLDEKPHWLVSFEEDSYGDEQLSVELVSID